MISTSDIRAKFLHYFNERGHEVVVSSSLVPAGDNTLLFTNAGMVQFKDVFLGQDKRDYNRATSSQRCVRAGGKHNDLENVGYTARHHTFFEMLGNFSFGDYFKENAIVLAWEFLTKELGLPESKLWVTVFEEDDEAYELWVKKIGVPEERVARIGAKDNFWQMGDTGPCGPCTEIFFDHGPEVEGGPPGTPEEDGDRYIEIWNLVFMQYDRSIDGTLTALPKPSVDTGMGLERVAAVLQGVHNNYEIDLFKNLIADTAEIIGTEELESASLKVVADHIRSCAFLVADGVMPSNEGRGYVLRRIIRRAARHGNKLGAVGPFFHKLVKPLSRQMGDAYPELLTMQDQIARTLLAEEEKFSVTLKSGMKILNEDLSSLKGDTIPGEILFKLYDTFGFPVDLTADIARERGLAIDKEGFELEMEKQRTRARASSGFETDMSARISADHDTEFKGYESLSTETTVVDIFNGSEVVSSASIGDEVTIVLQQTPFYAESGGQIGDSGILRNSSLVFTVKDTQKTGNAITHLGTVSSGMVKTGDTVVADVDAERRQNIVRNHSATHLLHAALQKHLSGRVEQKGSLVSDSNLRFDFSHDSPVSPQLLQNIERWVNNQVLLNRRSDIRQMSMDDAMKTGAMALFGEKYGDVVRVVSLGDNSTELCGGTHVSSTGDIGSFRILSETGVASGVRRIEAVSGMAALDEVEVDRQRLKKLAELLKTNENSLSNKLVQVLESNKKQQKEIQSLQAKLAQQAGDEAFKDLLEVKGVKLLCLKLMDVDTKTLREAADKYKDKLGDGIVVLASVSNAKVQIVVSVSKSLTRQVKAGDLVNQIAAQVGGKGGGRPDMAMAGGNNPENIDAALSKVPDWLNDILG